MSYKYDWGHRKVFYYTKIHSRNGYHWHHPCHEYPRADSRIVEKFVWTDMLMVVHKPDATKSRGQYLELLEMSVKEDPHCPRNAFYYARELTYYQRWQEAIVSLMKYLDMPESEWLNERAYAMRLIGESMENLGQDGMVWFRRGVAEDPSVRETWIALSSAASKKKLWAESFGAALSALAIENHQYIYTMNPDSFSSKPYDLAAIAAHYLGLKTEALKYGQKALEIDPNNSRLIKNLEFYME
jgi:tetratricopeptide (TPR) repeat protein